MKKICGLLIPVFIILIMNACSTTRSKDDMKGIKALYHNTTSKYNGYFNAKELMTVSILELKEMQENNYNKVLPVYEYIEVADASPVVPSMDKAIEKVIAVASIHEFSNYVDDCYVMVGKAQYLKQDYAAAEETFEFFEEEFDPNNPYGREYRKAKLGKKSKKDRERERKAERKEQEEKRKKAEDERKKKREEAKKEQERKKKEREQKAKERKKQRKNSKKRGRSTKKRDTTKKEEEAKSEKTEEVVVEKVEEEKKEEAEDEETLELEEKLKKKKARPQGEGGVFKNRTAYFEGLYWLARTYIETERYSSAKYILDRLENTDPLHEDVSNKLPAVKAHLLMRIGEEEEALVALDEAIELEGDKRLKARYAFIKGQLYEKQGSVGPAYDAYKKAKKLSPDYELKFNAELNELKLSFKTGKISETKALDKLEKMENDFKNQEFRDQIYFTKAQIRLSSNDIANAILDFEEAIAATGGNQNVKLEAYYKLAELLYAEEAYREAKANYDNALKIMQATDSRYKRTERLARNLSDIAKNIEIIEHQDSLLRLSRMSTSELKEIAEAAIREKKEMQAAMEEEAPANNPRSNVFASGQNRQMGAGRSNFFAYNPIALNSGKTEFSRTWGDRSLEDNWRRSLRADANSNNQEDEEGESVDQDQPITDIEISEYLREVPQSETQKKSANAKIEKALFELGILFRERLNKYDSSAEALDRLVKEYPAFVKRDEALYYLYLSELDNANVTAAELAKNKLINEFPDSKYAKLASDPAYAKSLISSEDNIASYYDKTYEMFENRQFPQVMDRLKNKSQLFPDDHSYDSKLDLLGAMCYGSLEGKDKYIKQLQIVTRKHKGTEEEVRANEILRFLKGDEEAFDEILFEESKEVFTLEESKLHYIFAVVYDQDQMGIQTIKLAISNYNKEYHRSSNLQISNITLNPEKKSHLILIRKFENKADALKYVTSTETNKDKFINSKTNIGGARKDIGYELYAVTQKNYREVIKQKSIAKYRKFYEKNYKK